jgi:hypothetical protein
VFGKCVLCDVLCESEPAMCHSCFIAAFHITDFRLVAQRQVMGRGRAARGGRIAVGDD